MADSSDSVSVDMETIYLGGKSVCCTAGKVFDEMLEWDKSFCVLHCTEGV
ncbi:hypothetical protein HanRHA438_Chr10g0477691 [Helianthus annuus]|nr:hypothetical protein HanRHA438_Chr10g0477691 [Helianthus annuus]